MFSTSKDILFLTIAICVAAFTVFSCWGLFYIVSAIRNLFKVTNDLKNILKKAEEAVDLLKNKIHESASYLVLFGEVLKKAMDVARGFSERRRERNRADNCGDEEGEDDFSEEKKSRPQKIKVK